MPTRFCVVLNINLYYFPDSAMHFKSVPYECLYKIHKVYWTVWLVIHIVTSVKCTLYTDTYNN